ncbi:hypothetical protein [Streptomyces sp. NPDC057557]|uniref:hypothetical protein n=1 Tax=Streptomyces sp. NPDC057557 TaxID=3346167 RepID=UPI0036C0BDB5
MASPTRPLDIDAEINVCGAETRGGPRTDHTVRRQVFAAAESDGGPGRVRDAR